MTFDVIEWNTTKSEVLLAARKKKNNSNSIDGFHLRVSYKSS